MRPLSKQIPAVVSHAFHRVHRSPRHPKVRKCQCNIFLFLDLQPHPLFRFSAGPIFTQSCDMFSKQDPYAIIKLDSLCAGDMETPTHWKGGRTPQWNHTFAPIDIQGNNPGQMTVTLFDEDTFTPDDLITFTAAAATATVRWRPLCRST